MSDISITELSQETGLSVGHIVHLIRRGILPKGYKEGTTRYLPKAESLLTIWAHKKPDSDWKAWEGRNYKRNKRGPYNKTWEKLK